MGEISGRLGERDFHRKYSDDEVKKFSDEERFIKLQECIIPYEIEMEESGIRKTRTTKDSQRLRTLNHQGLPLVNGRLGVV